MSSAPAGTLIVEPIEGAADRFGAAAEIFGEERFGDGDERLFVFGAIEAVALVAHQHIGDGDVFILHRLDDLVGFLLFDARIVGALADEERAFDLVDLR